MYPKIEFHKIKNQYISVKISELIELTEGRIVAGDPKSQINIERAFGSDLMSDVLTLDDHHIVLITGLAHVQLMRTVEMADVPVVLLCRNKKANPEMVDMANEIGIILIETPFSIFRASGVLYQNGLKPLY